MARSRDEIQAKLEVILGSSYVYFQPPTGMQLTYPCITYKLTDVDITGADNVTYITHNRYEVKVIDRNPDSKIKDKIIQGFPLVRFERRYQSDGLNHDLMIVYY